VSPNESKALAADSAQLRSGLPSPCDASRDAMRRNCWKGALHGGKGALYGGKGSIHGGKGATHGEGLNYR